MAASIYPDYPPKITDEQQARVLVVLNDWAAAHGLLIRPPSTSSKDIQDGGSIITAPVTLFPSPFPRSCFEEGLSIQKAYNSLYAAIASDEQWLGHIMKQ
jgi:glutathione synthase